jgi:hypothetical protein
MPGMLQLIPLERRSDDHSGTTLGIMYGRPKIMNGLLPPAIGTTLVENRVLAHKSATRTNLTRLDSRRRWMGAPMTP